MRKLPISVKSRELVQSNSASQIPRRDLGQEYGAGRQHIQRIVAGEKRRMRRVEAVRLAYQQAECIEDMPIAVLDLSARIKNAFENMGWLTVGDVWGRTDVEMWDIPNFGMKSMDEWEKCVRDLEHQFARDKHKGS